MFIFLFWPSDSISCNLKVVDAWAYQLQDYDIQQIALNSTFDLIVMDYSSDGSETGEWTPAQISTIKNSGKCTISYLSIGEAGTWAISSFAFNANKKIVRYCIHLAGSLRYRIL